MLKKIFTLARRLGSHGIALRVRRTEIVVFGYAEKVTLFSRLIQGKTVLLFDPTYQAKLYLFPFLRALGSKLFSHSAFSLTHHYFVHFLKIARPIVVLSHVDSNFDLWSARLSLKDLSIKFVVFQQGFRHEMHVPHSEMLGSNDVVICMTEAAGNIYRTAAGEARILPMGSLLSKLANEEMNLDVVPHRDRQACFISEWRPGLLIDGRRYVTMLQRVSGNMVEMTEAYKSEFDVLPKIASTLAKRGLKFHVLGVSHNLDEQERMFYEAIFGPSNTHWEFRARSSQETNYARLHDYAVAFCIDSTLGYEALAEGHKVIFPQSTDSKGLRHAFGYPNHQALASSPLHLREGVENEWEGQIADVLAMSSEDYEELARQVVGNLVMQTCAQDIRNVISELFREE